MILSEADRQKRNELQNLFNKGELDDNCLPYLRYLRGERNFRSDYPYMVQAHKIVQDSDLSINDIADLTGLSYNSVRYISRLAFKKVSEKNCKKLIDKLYSEPNK